MTKRAGKWLVTILVTVFMVANVVLPAFAWTGPHGDHKDAVQAYTVDAHVHNQSHAHVHAHRAGPVTASSPAPPCLDCDHAGSACNTCALACCGAILPSIATVVPRTLAKAAPSATESRLADGIIAARDPYPPRASQA
jgi:hypothetical protein